MEQEILYKGFTICIKHDEFFESPEQQNEDKDLFLTCNTRNLVVERQGFNLISGNDLVEDPNLDVHEVDGGKYHIFPIIVHDMVYFSSPINATGHIFVSFEIAEKPEDAQEMAHALKLEWNDYMTDNVWGYVIKEPGTCSHCGHLEPDMKLKDVDSCWGFSGDVDYCIESAKEAVNAEKEHRLTLALAREAAQDAESCGPERILETVMKLENI